MSAIKDAFQAFVHPEWKPTRSESALALSAAVGVPVALGFVSGLLCSKDIAGWYKTLKKPRWTPPAWVFGPTWTVLYVLLGFASWSVWTHGGTDKQAYALGFYVFTVLLNLAWTPLFFKARKLDLALGEVLLQLGALSATIVSFHAAEPLAALLLIPVWLVTLFAVFLTNSIFQLNPQNNRRALHKVIKTLKKYAAPE
jgi:tryptophan-rich sensory protein